MKNLPVLDKLGAHAPSDVKSIKVEFFGNYLVPRHTFLIHNSMNNKKTLSLTQLYVIFLRNLPIS